MFKERERGREREREREFPTKERSFPSPGPCGRGDVVIRRERSSPRNAMIPQLTSSAAKSAASLEGAAAERWETQRPLRAAVTRVRER